MASPLERMIPMDNIKKQKNSQDLKAKALKLKDLIPYQPGAIVSREILRKPSGTVTIFAFDTGEELSEHTAPFDALVFGLDGEADVTISGKRQHLTAGEMIIMPANEPHALKAAGTFKMALIMIRS
jgi:quercetin dioxygenase-like cupin family protein